MAVDSSRAVLQGYAAEGICPTTAPISLAHQVPTTDTVPDGAFGTDFDWR